ncbi:unnamed protein product [Symbiodinium sp. CCMP2456]|nr:unnamed protein product [Symbiodinium sp. CCMP2456]
MSRASSKGVSTVQRIQQLLHQMAQEHEAEVSRLKADVRRLSSVSGTSHCPPAAQPDGQPEAGMKSDNEGNNVLEQDSLREAAADTAELPPPPTGTHCFSDLGKPDVSPRFPEATQEDRWQPFSPSLSVDLDADEIDAFGNELDFDGPAVSPVRTIVYSLRNLPGSMLAGVEASDAKCKLVVKSEFNEGCTEFVPLQREEASMPGQVCTSTAWSAVWDETGSDVLLHVSDPLPEYVKIAIQIQGHETAIAEGLVTLNAARQKWTLFGGGEVDAEAVVEKALTPAGRRRESTVKDRIVEKLENLFDVRDPLSKVVMPSDVSAAVKAARNKRTSQLMSSLSPEDLEEVLVELKRIHAKTIDKDRKAKLSSAQPVISWRQFLDCIMLDDLPKYAVGPVALNLFIVQQSLLGDDMPSTGASGAYLMAYEKLRKPVSRSEQWVGVVTALSTVAIILSFLFLGLSLDIDPNWAGWIVLEGICAMVFVAEVVVKTYVLSPTGYFCGKDCVWNSFDVLLSMVAVGETILNIVFATSGSEMKAALLLRGLRLARMARLAKLVRMPLLEELANIVSGFVLSVRALFWVIVTLNLVIYVLSLGLRTTIQAVSSNALGNCPSGDEVDLGEPVVGTDGSLCKLHHMYGEEYCASVIGCMFSIFRCIVGECTTKGGRSLTMIFSDGFGVQFDIFYAGSMVIVLMGLFNIITAIFVEATLNGLKENESHRRYAKAYESSYMTEQLAKLVMVLSSQVQKMRNRNSSLPGLLGDGMFPGSRMAFSRRENTGVDSDSPNANLHAEETYLSEEEFNQLIRMPEVRMLLNELDVSVEPRPGVFEAFNTEEDGTVSISELVSGLMRLRGDLHKIDLVIAQMGLENMQKQIMEVKTTNFQIAKKIGAKGTRSTTLSRLHSEALS